MNEHEFISCEEYARETKDYLKKLISTWLDKPTLAIIQVGDNPASNSYIKGKLKDCEEVGIKHEHIHFDKTTTQELIKCIEALNNRRDIDGIIVQLPLPDYLNPDDITPHIAKEKDVDGFRVDSYFNPCTPKGIIDWLEYNDYDLIGKDVTVIGRSKIVGKPLVNMLIDKGATVTCCNSKTRNLYKHTKFADVIVSAVGIPNFLRAGDFIAAEVVIDVGINRDKNGKLCGDINREEVLKCGDDIYVTPVPKGVGLLTRVSLLENVYNAFIYQKEV